MLTEEDFGLFRKFRVSAMGEKLREIVNDPTYDTWTFEERVRLAIWAEADARNSRAIENRVKDAKFKDPTACVENILYLQGRTLYKDRILRYAECGWIREHRNLVVISKSGGGKSYVIQALGNAACRRGFTVRYARLSTVIKELTVARSEGAVKYYEVLDEFKSVDLLILDDFLTAPISAQSAIDLLEIIEAREGLHSTAVASQLDPEEWYVRVKGETMADSILSRLASRRPYLDIDGPNMREYLAEKEDEREDA